MAKFFDVAIEQVKQSFLDGFRPPPDFTISEWADEHRRLPRASSGEPGQWRTSRTPYLQEIMDEMSPKSSTVDVVVMKGSQVGYTEAVLNTAMFYIAHSPCSMLLVQPTIDIAERFSKQRLQPSLSECDSIQGKLVDNKSRAGGNTILQKDFPGGTLIIGGANSAAALRSMPIQTLLLDEVDAYPLDVDGEGDPVDLAIKRTTNFARKKRLYGSTPTVDGVSRIQKLFDNSDQRYFHIPCPFCGELQIIKWDHLKFKDRNPKTVYLECQKCKSEIHERYKTQMLSSGVWIPNNPGHSVAGFHISGLYSPVGWYSWESAVKDFLESVGNPNKMKVFVNTVLGEVWEDNSTSIDAHYIAKRKEKYSAVVPAGVLCLTAGVDTQDDRLECTVLGHGLKSETWVIDYNVFYGAPNQSLVWQLLDQHLLTKYEHESGVFINVATTCIDMMGHYTDEVLKYCSNRQARRVFPIYGKSGSGRPILGKGSRHKKYPTYVFQLGVDSAKELIYANLKIEEAGPGYIHFPDDVTDKYFDGLTAEKRVIRHAQGLPKMQWVLPSGKRNEPLDCFVYGIAGLQILNPNLELLAEENAVFQSNFSMQSTQKKSRRILSRGIE
jgi:phage terminase large subunit GpA-like protein